MRYQILLPGGELLPQLLSFLNQAGLRVAFTDKCYKYSLPNLPLDLIIVRASSVPEILTNPLFPTVLGGFTGSDVLWESGWSPSTPLPVPPPSTLFIGSTSDIANLQQLTGTTIATKYPKVAKDYFRTQNIPVNIYYIPGKDEALPYLSNQIQAILGIRQTGQTLAENNLKILQDIVPCTINWLQRDTDQPELLNFKTLLGL